MNQSVNQGKATSVAEAWRLELKTQGYEPPAVTRRQCLKFFILSRAWRRILRCTGLSRFGSVRALEFGCGGGAHLVPLFANGWLCTGVDCSSDVLERARQYVDAVRHGPCPPRGSIKFVCSDFADFETDTGIYDLTYQFGVLEHFLNDEERLGYVQKMFDATRPGGFVVSAVPSGCHPMRSAQRERGLGGYLIPEMDYSRKIIEREMKACGAEAVEVLPHDVFGYLRLKDAHGLAKTAYKIFYYLLQAPLFRLLPAPFLDRHAYWWIAIARKRG